ncbi:Caleosin related protein-domain-containing protein [Rhodotorula diobovata]|uniref:Caleosin related protein-domain-containing protein n=1 Tax=Rhodotorula diobovata TaxID=5288 RepID=A0A5C5FT57_9BASI|nr:Caleosin related protein-domain-containing protein [Rhodotorula diobovata]
MEDRPVAEEVDHIELTEPYVPRANIAATPEHPDGTVEGGWAKKHEHESVLQQHVHWWDPDHDGVIWPWDTFSGFHQLGFALFWCILSVFIIHPGFSWFTNESWIPNPLMPINVKHIHRAKHGSDAGVYDNAGRFVPARFEALFAKFGGDKGGITFWDGLRARRRPLGMLRANRNIADPVGWTGAFFELVATYLLIWPKDGIMTKEDWRVVYDGSIFPVVAARERERVESARRSSLFFRLFALLPLSGWFKENRAQSEEEVRKDDKDVDGKGSVWLEQKYRGRY